MKKLAAVFTLALLSLSFTASAATCGANPGRNSTTRAPATTGNGGTGTMGPAAGAGMGPGSVLPR